jgi:outer membrane biosynthesis protein TonB
LFSLLFVLACGGPPPAADPSGQSAKGGPDGKDATPAADPVAKVPAPDATAARSTTLSAGPAPDAPTKTDIKLDSLLPPKTVSAGGTYNTAVADAKGIGRNDVLAAIEQSSSKVNGCYFNLFKKPGKHGKTAFSVVIDPSGKTRSVKAGTDEIGDADLVKCLNGVLKGVTWPKPADKSGSSTTVEWIATSN